MLRLLLLVVLAAAPFAASAHGGHHEKAAAETGIRNSIAASAPCAPAGGEICSCHNLSCLSHFDPAPVLQAPIARLASQPARSAVAALVACALPPAPFVRFSPRGPPVFS